MLPLLLLLASPQTILPPAPPVPGSGAHATMRVFGQPEPGCSSALTPASDVVSGNSLMWREGQAPVGHYRLLDRQVNGCPAPIVVDYRVPGSNAVGREADRAPLPVPAPVRAR